MKDVSDLQKIRLALIAGKNNYRIFLREQFARYSIIEMVHEGVEVNRDVKHLISSKPDILFVAEGQASTFYNDLNPRFPKIRRRLPDTKIVVSTELPPSHQFVRDAREAGVNIISQSFEIPKVVEALVRVNQGESVEWYKDRGSFLESAHYSRDKER